MATYNRPKDIYELLRATRGADLTLAERAILLEQYSYAKKDGTDSRASEETMSRDLGVTTRHVRGTRRTLLSKGWLIERKRGHGGAKPLASVFEVVIPTHQKPVEPKPKRSPNNHEGINGSSNRKPGSGVLPEHFNQNPRTQPEAEFRPSTYSKADDKSSSQKEYKDDPWGAVPVPGTQSPGQPSVTSGTADAVRNGVGCVAVDVETVASVVGKEQSSAERHDPWNGPIEKCPRCKGDIYGDDDWREYQGGLWHYYCSEKDELGI